MMKSQDPLHFIAPVFLSLSLTHKSDNRIISIPKAVLIDNGADISFQTGPDDIIMNYSIFILHSPHPAQSISVAFLCSLTAV